MLPNWNYRHTQPCKQFQLRSSFYRAITVAQWSISLAQELCENKHKLNLKKTKMLQENSLALGWMVLFWKVSYFLQTYEPHALCFPVYVLICYGKNRGVWDLKLAQLGCQQQSKNTSFGPGYRSKTGEIPHDKWSLKMSTNGSWRGGSMLKSIYDLDRESRFGS